MERFGSFSVQDVLGDAALHNPKNAFTSSVDPHIAFDQLDIYLTPVKVYLSSVTQITLH